MTTRRQFLTYTGAAGGALLLSRFMTGCTPHSAPAEFADGRDASTDLGNWLRSLPPNSVADLEGRTYRCETHMKLTDKNNLTIRNGTITRTVKTEDPAFYYPNPNPFFWFLRPTNCAVRTMRFRGTNTVPDQKPEYGAYLAKYEFDTCVRVEQFNGFECAGLNADGIWGDGVQLQTGNDATVKNSIFDRVGRQGVTVIGTNILIDNVHILHGRRSGFDLEPDSPIQAVNNIEIKNSFSRSIGYTFASLGQGAVNDVYIHHNSSEGAAPVLLCQASNSQSRFNWRLEDHVANQALGSPEAQVRFGFTDNISIKRNTLPLNGQGRLGFDLRTCGGVCEATDNQFPGGLYYRNRTPRAGQTLTVANNTPALTEIP